MTRSSENYCNRNPSRRQNQKKRPAERLSILLGEAKRLIDPEIEKFTRLPDVHIQDMIDYSLRPSGHRERPLLVKLSCEAVSGKFENIIPAAIAIELFHFSTLVIDDIFDDSLLRGNENTVFVTFGTNNAIIVGQLLSSMGLEALTDLRHSPEVNSDRLLWSIDVFKDAQKHLYCGQYWDLAYQWRRDVTEAMYYDMVLKTTGSLIRCSVQMGAILGGGSKGDVDSFGKYGDALGIALQIRDDLAEIIGDPDVIGKKIGGDVMQGKLRLPLIRALACCDGNAAKLLNETLGAKQIDEHQLCECLDIMVESGAVDYCKTVTHEFTKKAVAHLDDLPKTAAKEGLVAIAEVVGTQW